MALIIRVGPHEVHRYDKTTGEALLACIQGMRTARWEHNQRVTVTVDGSKPFTYSDLEHIDTATAAQQHIEELRHVKTNASTADATRPPARRARKATGRGV